MLKFKRLPDIDLRPTKSSAVVGRLCRKLTRFGGYVTYSETIYRPARVATYSRVLAIYPNGDINQSGVAPSCTSSMIDPYAETASLIRAHVSAMENAARARKERRFSDARYHLDNALILRRGLVHASYPSAI